MTHHQPRHSRESGNPSESDSERMGLMRRRRAAMDSRFRGNDILTLFAIFIGLLLFVNGNAHAFIQQVDPGPMDPTLCKALVQHTPSPDVDYKPGVDVHGNYVAPADLDSTPSALPSKIKIPLTLSLAKVLNLDTSRYPTKQFGPGTEAQLGMIEVDGNKVTLNGKPLTNGQQGNLTVLCREPE